MQRSWLIRAGGWLWAVTGSGPSEARRVVRSPERLQQPSGEAKCFASSHFFHEPYALTKVACKDPGHSDQITTYDNAFTLALQNLRLYHLDSTLSPAQQAQMYYDNLPPLIRKHMALRDGKRADPEIRDNLDEVRAEARAVSHWSVFQAEAASLNGGRAMGALGASGTGTVGP